MAIVRWEPLRELSSLQNEMNRLFNTVFDAPAPAAATAAARRWMPAMDLLETEDHFVLRADLPGLTEEDVEIELEDPTLTVSGERQAEHEDKQEGFYRVERAFGTFSRILTLPEGRRRRRRHRQLRQRRPRGPHPEARGAQAAPHLDRRRRRAGDDRGRGQPSHRSDAGPRRGPRLPARVPGFEIRTRDPGSRARTGVLRLAHGEVSHAGLRPAGDQGGRQDARGPRGRATLGYDMVLGNTFHLFLRPGHERIARLGGLHRFMRWDGPIITDSGGFQVFSMGHGTVADEIKGRAAQGAGERAGAILTIEERGVRFRSYLDGGERFMGPETSMEVQAALGSDIALVFDECTAVPRLARLHRALDGAHAPLARPLPRWHAEHGPEGQVVYGIVQGGVDEDLRRWSAQEVAARDCVRASRSAARSARTRRRCTRWSTGRSTSCRSSGPRHLLGIGEVDDLVRGVELGIDTFDCAMPTRIGRHGMAVVPDPAARWRVDLAKGRWRDADEPLLEGCPCPACAHGYSRAYLHYLAPRARDHRHAASLTLHNLAYLQLLMAALRDAIDAGRLAEAAAAVRAGAAPWDL